MPHGDEAPTFPFLKRDMLKEGSARPMRLRLSAAADIVGEVTLRAITANGVIDLNVNTTADGIVNADTVGIDDFPIMISAIDEGDAYSPNQCWANISLELNEIETISLASGFVYLDKGIGWPDMNHVDAVPGRGFITDVASPNPVAGAEFALTVPAGELWHVKAGSFTFVTAVAAANRLIHVVFTTDGGVIYDVFVLSVQTASLTRIHSLMKMFGSNDEADDDNIQISIPEDIWLTPGSTIASDTQNLQAADDFTALTLVVEKFFAQT